ncbi:MAG: hypothetical protein ACFFFK_07380 [Candidatus Thorarchaeota archaeon]
MKSLEPTITNQEEPKSQGRNRNNPRNVTTNEKGLFIIHRHSGMALYSHEFVRGELDPQLLSGFIGAMTSFLGEALSSAESGWKTMYGSDTTLIVEVGEWTTAVLVVLKDNGLLHNKVRLIVAEFENMFQAFRDASCFEGGIIDAFDEFTMRVFLDEKISFRTCIRKKPDWKEEMLPFASLNQLDSINSILSMIDSQIAIGDIVRCLNISFEAAKEIVMFAYWHHSIDLRYTPSNVDILKPTEKSLSTIFSNGNPLRLSRNTMFIVGSLDGRKPLGAILERWNLDDENIKSELGDLITQGFLQKTTPEHNLILGHESVLNLFLAQCTRLVPQQTLKVALLTTFVNGIRTHPWLSRVQIQDGFSLQCQIDETMSPSDYGDLYDALQYVINETVRKLSVIVDEEKVNDALIQARMRNNT